MIDLVLLFIVILCIAYYVWNSDRAVKPSNKKTGTKVEPFTSCGCPELATWHPGRVEHKMGCSKFWTLNPNRTKEELLKSEGFFFALDAQSE